MKLIGKLRLKAVIGLDSQYIMKEFSLWNYSLHITLYRGPGTSLLVVLIFTWCISSKHYMLVMYLKRTLHDCPLQVNLVLSNNKITSNYELIWCGRSDANKPFDFFISIIQIRMSIIKLWTSQIQLWKLIFQLWISLFQLWILAIIQLWLSIIPYFPYLIGNW